MSPPVRRHTNGDTMIKKSNPAAAAAPVAPCYNERFALSDLLNEKEVATELGIAPGTLRNWRSLRIGVPFVKLGKRAVRYRRSDVEAFVASGMAQMEAA